MPQYYITFNVSCNNMCFYVNDILSYDIRITLQCQSMFYSDSWKLTEQPHQHCTKENTCHKSLSVNQTLLGKISNQICHPLCQHILTIILI